MSTNLQALKSAIKTVADAVNDTVAAIKPGQSIVARVANYYNLVADLESLVPQIGDIPAEVSALAAADYLTLTSELVTDLAVSDAKAQAIITASLKLLSDLALTILPDVEALVAATKMTVAPAPAPSTPTA